MELSKSDKHYNKYRAELSYGELVRLRDLLQPDNSNPIDDEMFNALDWYIKRLPQPGETKDDLKAKEEGGEAGGAAGEGGEVASETGGEAVTAADLDRELPEPPGKD